jgi:hypothetical protein
MKQVVRHFNRFLLGGGNSDVWSRELINGWFHVDDFYLYQDLEEREFINNYIWELPNE